MSITPANDDFGKYRLLLKLGRGGMAEVFVAVARGLASFHKLVVVKRLLPAMAADDDFRQMFTQEARLAARLNHPNVVQTYEIAESDEGMFIAMEYLEGQPLSRIARALRAEERKLHPSTCVRIACDVLAGLHHAHELRDFDGTPLNVVHRDVSPQNVFVTYQGHVKVLDFGIAKADRTSTKTQPGWLKGKYAYMAPEQFLGGDVDRRVDLFTTAIVLWELLAGRPLFGRSTEAMTVKSLVTEPVPHLSSELPSIDPELAAIVAKGLEREPEDRFATALEMKEALERVLGRLGQHEDLGRVVLETFAEQRRDVEQQIRRLLGDSARMSAAMPASSMTSLRAATLSAALPAGGSFSVHHPVAHTRAPSRPDLEEDDVTRQKFGLAGVIAAGAALVIGTLMIARAIAGPAHGPLPHPSVAAAPPPPPVTAPAPAPAPSPTVAIAIADPPAPVAREAAAPVKTATAPPRWTPPPAKSAPPAKVSSSTTASTTPAPPSPPTVTAPAPAPTPTSTAPEGRRFRTTL